MLRLKVTATGVEFFELNKAEPGTVLSTNNYTGSIDGSEDHGDGKIFSYSGSKRCPVKTIKAYLSHLNPEVDALFQRPKDASVRFSPEEDSIWFKRKVLGHNTLENMLKNMTQRAGIQPYFTNHSLRATTVTVLSSVNVETRQIKQWLARKSEASIESYCERLTVRQFQHMSSALTSFIHGKENTLPEQAASSSSTSTTSGSTKAVPSTPAEVVAVPTIATSTSTIQDEQNSEGIIQQY